MTEQNGEPAPAQEQSQIPEERRKEIQDEIAEAKPLPDPTEWETYGRRKRKDEHTGS